ncbi:MAG: hypothetical protein NC489_27035 [Ruminococcus flavefaciens]|nr:hypothetical protein [Ruminococcus flavefaciens]
MPFSVELKEKIEEYIISDLPDENWYKIHFYPFIKKEDLRNRLMVEYKNARYIYKFFEGMHASDGLLLAQIKTQVIMYVSIQEAIVNYVLFDLKRENEYVTELLKQKRLIQIDIPAHKKERLVNELEHDGKEIISCYYSEKNVDVTKIRYDQKINALIKMSLISPILGDDLIKLYEYRNTVHIEAEMKKNLSYDLKMGELAYRRIEGLSIELGYSLRES